MAVGVHEDAAAGSSSKLRYIFSHHFFLALMLKHSKDGQADFETNRAHWVFPPSSLTSWTIWIAVSMV